MKRHYNFHYQIGFTLIEMIMVIVILSVLSVGSVQFISYSAVGYVDTVRRSDLAATATIVNEKISRLVRDALPGSIRVNATQDCLEFVPILSASRYVQAPIVGSLVSDTQVTMVPVDGALDQVGYLAIYPVTDDVNDIYDDVSNPGIVSNVTASVTGATNGASIFTFSGGNSFTFSQASPQKRVFVTDAPMAFCQDSNQIFFYRNYGFVGDITNLAAALPSTVPNRLLVADNVLTDSVVFSILAPSLRRNAIVAYEFEFEDSTNDESLAVNQEIQIRNVP